GGAPGAGSGTAPRTPPPTAGTPPAGSRRRRAGRRRRRRPRTPARGPGARRGQRARSSGCGRQRREGAAPRVGPRGRRHPVPPPDPFVDEPARRLEPVVAEPQLGASRRRVLRPPDLGGEVVVRVPGAGEGGQRAPHHVGGTLVGGPGDGHLA